MVFHIPVLLKESIDGLNIKPDGIYIDLTFGGGGHSKEILNRLKNGRLIAFDQDEDTEANVINDDRFLFIRQNFRFIRNFLRYYQIRSVDGIMADLGVSSHQLDMAERGFSFRLEGKLDMRMNRNSKFTAKELLNKYTEEKLYQIFKEYGEIRNAKKLTDLIIKYRSENEITRVKQFTNLISDCLPKNKKNKYLARFFQAIRIEVNNEISLLKEMLLQTVDILKKNGRLVIISYHSLEDRLVKNFMKKGIFEGEAEKDFYGNLIVPFEPVNKKVITPDKTEIKINNRARSAKLRIAKRI